MRIRLMARTSARKPDEPRDKLATGESKSLGNIRLRQCTSTCSRTTIAAGTWSQHGHSERRRKAYQVPAVSARFYFASEADAEAFRMLWETD
jgi:hypothetical protein